MLYPIPVHVIDVPQAPFSSFLPALRDSFAFFYGTRKVSFQQIPAHGKIRVTGSQRPNTMEMIRQDHHRIQTKWTSFRDVPKRPAQRIDLIDEQTVTPPLGEIDRKDGIYVG